ncbi:MAG TPA: hypothetical protein VLB44_17115 [Kofleriaceae bacterium]|nr:hypothetical protein [Kofleriaceae bacterium]
MHVAARRSLLDARLTEVLMSALCPCDLGDGIEVVHDVEAVEIEMECDVGEDAPPEPELADDIETTIKFAFDANDEVVNTTEFARADDVGTHQFVRHSAPYERIEIQLDPHGFVQATIEEARSASAPQRC